jgi:hypothetical protein
MDEYFYSDFLKEVSPLTLYELKLSNKSFNDSITLDVIKTSIIKEINRRLSIIFGDELNNFKTTLDKSKSIIAGSFVLQCILGEYWDKSDIDIYYPIAININNNNTNNIINFFGSKEFAYNDLENFFINLPIIKFTVKHVTNYAGDAVTIRDFESCNTGVKIQIVEKEMPKNYDDINSYINTYFDFDVCNNMFYHENGIDKIKISNLESIFNKIIQSKRDSTMDRYEKYSNRGFKIVTTYKTSHQIHVRSTGELNTYQILYGNYDSSAFPKCNNLVIKLPENVYDKYSTICHDDCCLKNHDHFHYTFSFCDYIFFVKNTVAFYPIC